MLRISLWRRELEHPGWPLFRMRSIFAIIGLSLATLLALTFLGDYGRVPRPASNSLFPHLGYTRRWYLSRHAQKQTNLYAPTD